MFTDCVTEVGEEHSVNVRLHRGDSPPETSSAQFEFACWMKQENAKSINEIVEDIVEEIVEIENVTVKFYISETQVIARVYPNRLTIADVKKDIARKFEVDLCLVSLKQCDNEVADDCLLLQTAANEYGIHEFCLSLIIPPPCPPGPDEEDDSNLPRLDLNVYYSNYQLPDFITVHIPGEDTEDGEPRDLVVEIQKSAIKKPFLGGYKDKRTGIEYMDSFTQTGPCFDKWLYRRYRSRDTQTYDMREKLVDTSHDQSTMCWLDGNNVRFVSAALDYNIVPKKYQTAAQLKRAEDKLNKILLLQRNWRRVLAERFIKKSAEEYRRLVANRLAADKEFEDERLARIKKAERAKKFPHTKDDFDFLLSEVAKWKIAELKRISSMYEGAARIAEVNLLLDREIDMLNAIDRQRRLVTEAMQDFRDEQLFKKLGKPIQWIGYNDTRIHMDLVRTQRARFLHEIYKDLKLSLPKQKRLELIDKVRQLLTREQDFPGFAELFDLFDREKNLLIYTKYCDVEVLRRRQLGLFKELIQFAKDTKPKKIPMRLCSVCKKVKPISQFAIFTRQNQVDSCKKCHSLKLSFADNNSYITILRAIQEEERNRECFHSFAFIIQVDDIRYLIDRIWHGHSIITKKHGELGNLRLPRWIKGEDWSPWNCFCVTEEEARTHYNFADLTKIYDDKLIEEVGNRHKLARRAFQKLIAVATEYLETGEWWNVGMNKQRSPMMNPLFGGENDYRPTAEELCDEKKAQQNSEN